MDTKERIKARELSSFCESLDGALEDAIHNFLADKENFKTEGNMKVYDVINIAWDEAFNFDAFDKLIQRNFNRGFEAAWKAYEKTKTENLEDDDEDEGENLPRNLLPLE